MHDNSLSKECKDGFIPRAINAVGEAVYHWDIATDTLTWSSNAAKVLGVNDEEKLRTGRAFASLLDRENITSRYDTVMRSSKVDAGEGVPFSIEYMIRPWGQDRDEKAWVEDAGRWFAHDGERPREVFGIIRRIDERYKNDQKLHYQGSYDPLTGLMNRASMGEALDEAILASEMRNTSCAFMIASVDNISVIADAYGYDIAEEVITRVGKRLKRVARAGDAVARYSESKFGLILHDCREEDLEIAAERFLSVANEHVIETTGGPVWAMLSVGAAILPLHAHEHNAAIACAEEALAEAMRMPMSASVIYKPAPDRISQRTINARCAAEIVDSLKQDRFTLAFQPIVDARSGEPVMHESLLRMQDNSGDIIAAAHLIPIAEKLGLIRLIDLNVMELVVETLRNNEDACLTMNVSGVTAADPGWFDRLIRLLAGNPQVTSRLVVEITETVVLNELDETMRFIAGLRAMGCKVAIDDFGSGYTSYRNLKMLDVDLIKLDGVFCDKLAENPDNQYFVRSIADLANNLDLKIIAEWVQTEEDAALLRDWGVHYFQGHLFGAARIDHPWPSPRLASRQGFNDATDKTGEEAPAPGGDTGHSRRARDVPPLVTPVLSAAPETPHAEPPQAAGASKEKAMPETDAAGTDMRKGMDAPAPAEPSANAAQSSLESIMSQLDREMADLKAVLDSMHKPHTAASGKTPVSQAG